MSRCSIRHVQVISMCAVWDSQVQVLRKPQRFYWFKHGMRNGEVNNKKKNVREGRNQRNIKLTRIWHRTQKSTFRLQTYGYNTAMILYFGSTIYVYEPTIKHNLTHGSAYSWKVKRQNPTPGFVFLLLATVSVLQMPATVVLIDIISHVSFSPGRNEWSTHSVYVTFFKHKLKVSHCRHICSGYIIYTHAKLHISICNRCKTERYAKIYKWPLWCIKFGIGRSSERLNITPAPQIHTFGMLLLPTIKNQSRVSDSIEWQIHKNFWKIIRQMFRSWKTHTNKRHWDLQHPLPTVMVSFLPAGY